MADDQTIPQGGRPVGDASPASVATPDKGEDAAKAAQRSEQRRRLFTILGGVILICAIGYLLYWLLIASHYVSTDNAYVGAEVAQVTPLVSGEVAEVRVANTQPVKAGDVLVVIDPADAKIAAEHAAAAYDQATRIVRQSFATTDQLNAQVAARQADLERAKAQLASAESDVTRAKIDYDRRVALANSGAVSGEELTSSKNAYQNAQANLAATKAAGALAEANAKAAVAAAQAQGALTQGTTEDTNPQAQSAKAAYDQAKLDLSRTVIRSPEDGVIVQRNVQVGQRIAAGTPMMSIAPLGAVYVDANFKEVQLRKVRIGQPVTLTSDKYGGGVVFHGRVAGVGGGTGAAFAVIPAQNATGNWIKVVQRLPVRIRLDGEELKRHPLEVGLSMNAKINVANPGDDRPQDRLQDPSANRQGVEP
jgi:membrane fusion protein (multidrug efflux system)